VVAEQTVAVQRERFTLLEIAECLEKRLEVAPLAKYVLPIVPTSDHMVNQAVIDGRASAAARRKSMSWKSIFLSANVG
jgi:hypothetical protein